LEQLLSATVLLVQQDVFASLVRHPNSCVLLAVGPVQHPQFLRRYVHRVILRTIALQAPLRTVNYESFNIFVD
jgi:hypothetical protein